MVLSHIVRRHYAHMTVKLLDDVSIKPCTIRTIVKRSPDPTGYWCFTPVYLEHILLWFRLTDNLLTSLHRTTGLRSATTHYRFNSSDEGAAAFKLFYLQSLGLEACVALTA